VLAFEPTQIRRLRRFLSRIATTTKIEAVPRVGTKALEPTQYPCNLGIQRSPSIQGCGFVPPPQHSRACPTRSPHCKTMVSVCFIAVTSSQASARDRQARCLLAKSRCSHQSRLQPREPVKPNHSLKREHQRRATRPGPQGAVAHFLWPRPGVPPLAPP
jgi:hypothetical protein